MTTVAAGIRYIDVAFRQNPLVIASAVLDGPDGVALIDPGPTSCLPTLRDRLRAGGIEIRDIRTILLTHIHLDHAGATGSLVQENPSIRVIVHEKGAPHMVDPAKLLASATRLYGPAMDELWGPFLPVPAANVTAVSGAPGSREPIEAGGRTLDVAYTPGHASHHVCYFDARSGIAFVGDMAGVRIPPSTFVIPPTPPPDIDIELWAASIDRILAWHPSTLFLTHFGPIDTPGAQLQQTIDRLQRQATLAKEALALPGDLSEEARAEHFTRALALDLRRSMSEADAARYELAIPLHQCWQGLARYWRKREGHTRVSV
jgi:glyoxylase-like metal-dependent hydrolase (beta-lactamase superfamily II)